MIPGWLSNINTRLRQAEDFLLALLFITTLTLAVTQIILRNIFGLGLVWIDPLLRILVLWIGMLGALYATRKNRHISIEVLHLYIKPGIQKRVTQLVQLFSSAVCFICLYFSIPYLWLEYQDGSKAFSQVPLWMTESIIPFALLVMGLRFLSFALFEPAAED